MYQQGQQNLWKGFHSTWKTSLNVSVSKVPSVEIQAFAHHNQEDSKLNGANICTLCTNRDSDSDLSRSLGDTTHVVKIRQYNKCRLCDAKEVTSKIEPMPAR